MPEQMFYYEVGCAEDSVRSRTCSDKLSRSERYELENALVGLCDVWFDEIKPHLVRNNIKLHISCGCAGEEQEHPPSAPSGSANPADDCTHLDLGAAPDHLRRNAGYGSSSRSLAPAGARVVRGRLRGPLLRPLSPLISVPQSPLISVPQSPRGDPQIQSHNCEKKLERPRKRRKRRRFRAQAQPSWRVPRLCRTQPALRRAAAGPATASTSQLLPGDNYYRFIVPRREFVSKNKNTQTPVLSVACQPRNPGYRSPDYHSPSARSPGPRSPSLRSPSLRSPGPRSHVPRSSKYSPTSCDPDPSSPDGTTSPQALRPAIICQVKRSDVPVIGIPPLLQDDLMDIVTASNEKRLRLLYSSSERDDHPTFLNLLPDCRPEKTSLKKLPPWR